MSEKGESDFAKLERLQAQAGHHLRHTPNPSLEAQYNYYLERSKDTSVPAKQRKLWKQLADEIAPRLKRPNDRTPGAGDLPLPFG